MTHVTQDIDHELHFESHELQMKYPNEESITLEFKSELPKNDQIVKTIIGFCNQHGGKLILGVEDNGTILGLKEENIIMLMEQLEHTIYKATAPPIIPRIFSQRIGNKMLLIIEVSEGMNKPYYRYSEGLNKGTYIRIGKNTIRASAELIEELKWQSRGLSFENLPVYHSTEDELDHKKISAFLENRRQNIKVKPSANFLLSYKLLVEEHSRTYPTVGGILLFGKRVQYHFPDAMILCSHFKGTSGRNAIAAVDCTGTLFEQFEQAYQFLVSRLEYAFEIKGTKRKEKLEIPQIALREILLNAIVHRNYHIRGPSKIAIYDDRIEIFSPGNFPTPFPNLRLGLTDARNANICRIFREVGLIEKLGSGFIAVFDSYENWNLPEPKIMNGDGFVKCILPRAGYRAIQQFDQTQKILSLFESSDELSVSDVMDTLKMPRSTASRKLRELVQKQKLKRIGQGKIARYIRLK